MELSVTDPYYTEQMMAQQALYQVIDPELFVNVIDLGLIYKIDFTQAHTASVLMTLSTPHCPMGEAITNGVRNALEITFPGKTILVELTFDPPWNYEMITEEGKRQLGI